LFLFPQFPLRHRRVKQVRMIIYIKHTSAIFFLEIEHQFCPSYVTLYVATPIINTTRNTWLAEPREARARVHRKINRWGLRRDRIPGIGRKQGFLLEELWMSGHNGPSDLSPSAGLEQANRECRVSWEGCKTQSASTGCSAPIPQCHTHHHIIRRDAWGQGRLPLIGS